MKVINVVIILKYLVFMWNNIGYVKNVVYVYVVVYGYTVCRRSI